jgi:hypothetical protein
MNGWPSSHDPDEIAALIAQAVDEQHALEQGEQWLGTVYLLHFAVPLHHAQHYLGWTRHPLAWRLTAHRQNQGARLLRAANLRGIEWWLVRTWEGCDRAVERRLKDRHESPRLCPLCNPHAWEIARCPLSAHAWEPWAESLYSLPGYLRCAVCQQRAVCLGCSGLVAPLSPDVLVLPCARHGGEVAHG